jgi:prolyl 4-hydroxylase
MLIKKRSIKIAILLILFLLLISILTGFKKRESFNANLPTGPSTSPDKIFDTDGVHVSIPKYSVQEIENFLTDEECDKLIELASTRLEPSRVYTESSDLEDNDNRKSDQAWLLNTTDPLVLKISQKVADLTHTPVENQEDMQVVHYEAGGFFRPHYDACEGTEEFCQRMNGTAGSRIWTYLIYLNDENLVGGETYFPSINKKVIPKKGKCVVFQSTDETGRLIRESLHGGEPVTSGVKWICNKWVRKNKYR